MIDLSKKDILIRLKEARKDLGLTQSEFAEKLGMTLNAYNLIENGKRNLTERHIKAICAVFGISEGWLRGLRGYEEFDNMGLSQEIMDIAKKLNTGSQKILLTLARSLYDKQVDEYEPPDYYD